MEVFKSWGVVGDWEHHYETKSVPYIENQLKQFLLLYNKKVIYRDVKPIYWSPSSRLTFCLQSFHIVLKYFISNLELH